NDPHVIPTNHVFNTRHQQLVDETQYQLNLHNSYMQKAKEIQEKALKISTSFEAKQTTQKTDAHHMASYGSENRGDADTVRKQVVKRLMLTTRNAEPAIMPPANNDQHHQKNTLMQPNKFENYMRHYTSFIKSHGMKISDFLSQSSEIIFS